MKTLSKLLLAAASAVALLSAGCQDNKQANVTPKRDERQWNPTDGQGSGAFKSTRGMEDKNTPSYNQGFPGTGDNLPQEEPGTGGSGKKHHVDAGTGTWNPGGTGGSGNFPSTRGMNGLWPDSRQQNLDKGQQQQEAPPPNPNSQTY